MSYQIDGFFFCSFMVLNLNVLPIYIFGIPHRECPSLTTILFKIVPCFTLVQRILEHVKKHKDKMVIHNNHITFIQLY
jgi:hypothetical protein